MKARCAKLQRILYEEVSLSETIGVGVHGYDGERLDARPSGAQRQCPRCRVRREHLLHLRSVRLGFAGPPARGRGPESKAHDRGGEIGYFKPVDQTINAVSRLPDEGAFDEFVRSYKEKGKARIKVPVCIEMDDGTEAARFTGDFIALRRQEYT